MAIATTKKPRPTQRQEIKAILRKAAPETLARFREFNRRALAAIGGYHPVARKQLMSNFRADILIDGLDNAMDNWGWLVQ